MDIILVPTKSIKPYEKNPRKNNASVDKVMASIREFGFKQPIVVDKNNIIIVGHTRYKAAIKLGINEVPVIVASDLSEDQVKAYRLADNKTAEFSEWNAELLAGELDFLASNNYDMQPFGFEQSKPEIIEDDFDVEAAIPEIAITMPGDLWQLGDHRLLCGDSTLIDDMDKLMGGKVADMVFTDPPYNINYEGKTKAKLTIKNDKMTDDKFYAFLYDAFVCLLTAVKDGGGYIHLSLRHRGNQL